MVYSVKTTMPFTSLAKVRDLVDIPSTPPDADYDDFDFDKVDEEDRAANDPDIANTHFFFQPLDRDIGRRKIAVVFTPRAADPAAGRTRVWAVHARVVVAHGRDARMIRTAAHGVAVGVGGGAQGKGARAAAVRQAGVRIGVLCVVTGAGGGDRTADGYPARTRHDAALYQP